MMMMKTIFWSNLLEWRLAGEAEVHGGNLPRRHFVHHKSHMMIRSRTPDRSGGKPATNRLSYGAASQYYLIIFTLRQKFITTFECRTRKKIMNRTDKRVKHVTTTTVVVAFPSKLVEAVICASVSLWASTLGDSVGSVELRTAVHGPFWVHSDLSPFKSAMLLWLQFEEGAVVTSAVLVLFPWP
jgi:hypothetical protein